MRLTLLVIAGIWGIGLAGFYVLVRQIHDDVERQYAQAAEEPMVDMARLFAAMVETDMEEGRLDVERLREAFQNADGQQFEARIYDLRKTGLFTHVYVTDRAGQVLLHSGDPTAEGEDYGDFNDVARTLRGEYGARSTRKDPDDSMSSTFYVGAPLRWGGEIVGMLSVARPESTMAGFVEETRAVLVEAGRAAALFVTVLGSVWVYVLLRPIGGLTGYARAVGRGERAVLPRFLGFGETRMLGEALEGMRGELEGKAYVERYIETLTHELKSPLSAIRGAAELMEEPKMPEAKRERFREIVRTELERCEDLVERLLELAALEKRPGLERKEAVDLGELVRQEAERARSAVEGRGRAVRIEGEEVEGEAMVWGDRFVLESAVRNLLDNALDFAPDGTEVRLVVRAAPRWDGEGSGFEIAVRDEGPGLPDYAVERVFERFYSLKRDGTGRKSSGLGLCFVKEAAALHGGRIVLENREPRGLEARLWLPER